VDGKFGWLLSLFGSLVKLTWLVESQELPSGCKPRPTTNLFSASELIIPTQPSFQAQICINRNSERLMLTWELMFC
jgi:hypothetical protein